MWNRSLKRSECFILKGNLFCGIVPFLVGTSNINCRHMRTQQQKNKVVFRLRKFLGEVSRQMFDRMSEGVFGHEWKNEFHS
uniref:Uncharacterized protein n=1 Tax=Oryza brachyantha TaxID=4533 RepID=J3KZB7_ORYBR